jgi:hypothetical protein
MRGLLIALWDIKQPSWPFNPQTPATFLSSMLLSSVQMTQNVSRRVQVFPKQVDCSWLKIGFEN